jgi:hypothetical protein
MPKTQHKMRKHEDTKQTNSGDKYYLVAHKIRWHLVLCQSSYGARFDPQSSYKIYVVVDEHITHIKSQD